MNDNVETGCRDKKKDEATPTYVVVESGVYRLITVRMRETSKLVPGAFNENGNGANKLRIRQKYEEKG